jgi:hypothetical protein
MSGKLNKLKMKFKKELEKKNNMKKEILDSLSEEECKNNDNNNNIVINDIIVNNYENNVVLNENKNDNLGCESNIVMSNIVVNVKKDNLKKMGYVDFEDWNKHENHVYIGRNMNFYVKGTLSSKWRNIFSVKKFGRDECLRLYEEYIRKSDLYNDLDELNGKVLGCWCAPEGCHGDVLFKLLKEKNEKNCSK